MGISLMIIKLRRYIEVRELLIENRTTELQQVHYQDGVWRVSVHMEEKGTGMQTGYRGAYSQPLSWK